MSIESEATETYEKFVALRDDLFLQPPENIVPIIRIDALERWGPTVTDALERLALRLTTAELRDLNRSVADGESVSTAASGWLTAVGLVEP